MPMMPMKLNKDGLKNYLKDCGILSLVIGFLILTGVVTEYLFLMLFESPEPGLGLILGLILGMFGYSFLYGLIYFSFFAAGQEH